MWNMLTVLAIFFTLKVTAKVCRVLKKNQLYTDICILNNILAVFSIYISRLMRNLYKTDHFLNHQTE